MRKFAACSVAPLETGGHDIIENAGASFVSGRVNDDWMAAYYHESLVPPERESLE